MSSEAGFLFSNFDFRIKCSLGRRRLGAPGFRRVMPVIASRAGRDAIALEWSEAILEDVQALHAILLRESLESSFLSGGDDE